MLKQRFSIYTLIFAICACAGWIYETIENVFTFGGIYLRAAFLLPWCPIYGIGGLILIIILDPLRKFLSEKIPSVAHAIIMILCIYILTSIIELVGSYICEAIMGFMPWDYSAAPLNFQGRIAPMYTARFVILGIIAIYLVKPTVTNFVKTHSKSAFITSIVLTALFVGDYIIEQIGYWDTFEDTLKPLGINHW